MKRKHKVIVIPLIVIGVGLGIILGIIIGLTIASFKVVEPKVIIKRDTVFFKPTIFFEDFKVLHATWYNQHGAYTASGVKMDKNKATCAYNNFDLGTKLLVTNINNGKRCIVTITDRMGNKDPKRIDLSHKAFGQIAPHKLGLIYVTIEVM